MDVLSNIRDTADYDSTMDDFLADAPRSFAPGHALAVNASSPNIISGTMNGKSSFPPATPIKITDKPLPKDPPMTPRIKKKVPWKGKNIMILIPRDDKRGLPGRAPKPLTQDEIARMFSSWRELGYNTDGFDLLVERYPSIETGHSYSRDPWPSQADLVDERATGRYTVVLPDLNSWKNYVHELQEAKLRALGVSFGDEEPEPAPSISSQPSRLPSAQYPALPFTPPIPTSSASSNHAISGLSFPPQFLPGGILATHSPGMPPGASPVPFAGGPPKYPRQSISFPATHSPYQHPPHGWPGGPPGAMHGMDHHHSPSLMNLGGVLPGQSPYGLDGFQPTGSPALNLHQRHHSLQYPPPQQLTRTSPRLQDVREDEEEEEEERQQQQHQQQQQQRHQQQQRQQQQQQQKKHIIVGKNSSEISDPAARNAGSLQAEIDDAEYHLEEQLRNELEHEDYNPHAQVGSIGNSHYVPPPHMHQTSTGFPPAEHFANEPAGSLVLHHPRPHSRGHSLSQSFFREQVQESMESAAGHQPFAPLKNMDGCEIETNPSNLGTPVNMDFTAAFHNKTISTVSNPWQDAVSVSSSARHSSHGSKPSSKFNVEAPEFKFNPTSSFTPGLFNFSSNSVNNSVTSVNNLSNSTNMGGGIQPVACHPAAGHAALTPSKINAAAPAFAPGQSEFSFTSPAGLKFRPDAPSFTPLATQATAASSPVAGGSHARGKSRRADSIFGDIHVSATELGKKSRSFTSIRRSSTQSSQTGALEADSDLDGYDAIEGSKPKRAKSAPLDSDDIPLFAERPAEIELLAMADQDTVKESRSEADVEVDRTQPDDTSFSSAASSEQLDTQATTAAPSETSPAIRIEQKWTSTFEFGSLDRVESVTEKRALGQDDIKSPASVASTPAFASGAVSLPDDGQDAAVEEEETEKAMEVVEEEEQRKSDSTLPPVASVGQLAEPAPIRRKLTPKGLSASRFASPPSKPRGLAASRFARSPSPILPAQDDIIESVEQEDVDSHVELDVESGDTSHEVDREPTFEEIDAVMKHFEKDPSKGINKCADARRWSDDVSEPSEDHSEDLQDVQPAGVDDAARPIPSTELEDPFLDPPIVPQPPRRAIGVDGEAKESEMGSDWEGAFSEDEHSKLQSRAQFFDSRVYEVLGGLLASSLEPLAKSISSIHHSLETKSQRAPSSRRDRRSASVEYQESDADDEDDESPPVRRSLSPKRDRRLEQIRLTVTEALAAQQRNQPLVNMAGGVEDSAVLRTLNEIKEQLVAPTMAQAETSKEVMELSSFGRMDHDWAAKAVELEQRLQLHQERLDKEIHERRVAEDVAAELTRKLHAAETRVEAGILNGSNFDVRVNELEGRLRHQEDQMEEEIRARRTAEDQVCEAQRTLRIASEEERRLRDVVDEKSRRIHDVEQTSREMSLRLATVEVERSEWTRGQSDLAARVHSLEAEVRTARKDNSHWRAEAERADEVARRNGGELGRTIGENKRLQKSLDKVVSQLEENERLRESWRAKFLSLQEDMGRAAREVAEENARHIKRDQAMVARREVLEARLQAEAKTRERLEVEMDRLQENERAGMRAVNECRRLEELVAELRLENGRLQQGNSRYQRVEAANHHGKQAREELEEQNLKLRAELESVKVMLSTSKAQHEMLLEGAHKSRLAEVEELQGRYERQLSHALEDGRRTEQHLLERLSLATSKGEHLADRIMLLEDKLEITKQAAAAAAQAAKMAGVDSGVMAATTRTMMTALPDKISPQALRESIMVLQEQLQAREQRVEELEQTIGRLDPDAASKISKRDDEISWLRELLSVRHENLQDIISALSQEHFDRDAVKDAAIRLKANLQMEEQERERAMNGGSAISLPLPSSIAQAVQAATPRVAQTIGPIAAAWGNWRKGASTPTLRGLSGVLGSTAAAAVTTTSTSTPTGIRKAPTQQGGMRGGLLTPPASGLRQSSPVMEDDEIQPTAFASTGRRFPQALASGLRQSSPVMDDDDAPQPTAFASTGRRFPQTLASGLRQSSPVMDDDETQPTAFASTGRRFPQTREARRSDEVASTCRAETVTPNADDVVDEEEEEEERAEEEKERVEEPMTPPMMNSSVYDEDAKGVFDEDDFFEEE